VLPALSWWKLPFLSHFHHELLESWEPRLTRADLIRPPDALMPSAYLPVVSVARALEASAHHVKCPSLPGFPRLEVSPVCACWCRSAHRGHPGRPLSHSGVAWWWLTQAKEAGGGCPCGPTALVDQVLPWEGGGSSLSSCTKLEAFQLLSCHHSQVCIISFLLLSANLSLAILVVPVALLLLLAPVVYFLSVLGAACFLSGFTQI